MKKLLLPALALASLTLSACTVQAHPVRPRHHGKAKAVVIKKGHVHTKSCGHYRHGGTWYHLRGHVHGARCGHALAGGIWIVRR